ncbi:hypothetical protein CRG98_005916 [Punica granatum]|uniref:Uncharacterized protein n=1 Tax=Punica granatum TaxID=22663 RepID=A0A2I0KYX6_PUNGR|nr:hypothetical protein CRG98_005916 [Punica granatum]
MSAAPSLCIGTCKGWDTSLCGVVSALWEGREVHCNLIENGFNSDVIVQSALNRHETALIAGYVQNGLLASGLAVVLEMFGPAECNYFANLGPLGLGDGYMSSQFRRAGRVMSRSQMHSVICMRGAGTQIWKEMCLTGRFRRVSCRLFNFNGRGLCIEWAWACCTGSLLENEGGGMCSFGGPSRAGRLFKGGLSLHPGYASHPHSSVWGGLLGGCKMHGDVESAELVYNRLFELNPDAVTFYVHTSNIHAEAGWGKMR